jgi:hypothetical protein
MLLWSVVLVTRPNLTTGASFIAFLLVGFAALVKPQYLLFGALFGFTILRNRGDHSRIRLHAVAVAGVAIPLCVCLAIYLQAGRLDSIWEVLALFNLSSHVTQHVFTLREFIGKCLGAVGLWGNHGVLILEIMAAIGYFRLRLVAPRRAWTLAGASAIAVLIAISQNKFYLYHFLPYFTFLAALGGPGFAAVTEAPKSAAAVIKAAARSAAGVGLIALLVIYVTKEPAKNAWNWWTFAVGLHDAQTYDADFCSASYNGFCHADVARVARVVAEATPPGSPVYLWGYDALLYFLADRPAASRFGFDYPIIAGSPAHHEAATAELMTALARTRPLFIIVEENDRNNLLPFGSRRYIEDVPRLKQLIAEDYTETYRNDNFTAYRRRNGS